MRKWMILVVFAILLGGSLAAGCGNRDGTTEESQTSTLALTVTQPLNEATVHTADLVVKGQTEPDAVVSVDGLTVEVDVEGKFSTTVTLEEGPNPIEVHASDFEGNEGSVFLTVMYVK